MKDLLHRAGIFVRTSKENFTSSFGRLLPKIAPKSVPHVQRDYFFLIQPIISLIRGVVVLVAVAFSETPVYWKREA